MVTILSPMRWPQARSPRWSAITPKALPRMRRCSSSTTPWRRSRSWQGRRAKRAQARVIAVTGSVGKTGTKEALRLLLSAAGPSFANPASFNNQWGVPLSLAALPRAACFGVFEIGMNHADEIAPLTGLVRPDVAVVTNVEPVHTEFFASLEAICDAKAEIFEGMGAGGTAVLNRDNRFYGRLVIAADACGVTKVVSFGEHADATLRLVDAEIATEAQRCHRRARRRAHRLPARRAGPPLGDDQSRRACGRPRRRREPPRSRQDSPSCARSPAAARASGSRWTAMASR